jgi:hypothetical protein
MKSFARYLLWGCLSLTAFAQDHFFDAPTVVETSVYVGAIALDGWATQNAINQHRGFVEENPLARPFIHHGVAGQVGASAIGLAVGIGPSYLFYRKGHHKIARIWLTVFTAGEAINAGQMAYLVTHHH